MTIKAEELKPCPFCLGRPYDNFTRRSANDSGYFITCENKKCVQPSIWRNTEEEARNIWNTRADLDAWKGRGG